MAAPGAWGTIWDSETKTLGQHSSQKEKARLGVRRAVGLMVRATWFELSCTILDDLVN